MKMRFDKDISNVFVTCFDYWRANAPWDKKPVKSNLLRTVQSTLRKTLSAMAQLHQALYSGWSVDRDHPGYLMKVEPPIVVRVPYMVLPVFPKEEDLQEIWELSRRIQSSDDSIICISGSNVLRRIFDIVGDIDFCEYVTVPSSRGLIRLESNVLIGGNLRCLRVSFGRNVWVYPWNSGKPQLSFFTKHINPTDELHSSCKYDYIGTMSSFGIKEITNMIILCDRKGGSASLKKTFAAQEAPLSTVDWLPNQIDDPRELGRYIDYLVGQITDYLKRRDFVKCLKRCASLSRIMFLSEITNSIGALARSSILIQRKSTQMADLRNAIEPLSDSEGVGLKKTLDIEIETVRNELRRLGGPTPEEVNKFEQEVTSICNRLLARFELR